MTRLFLAIVLSFSINCLSEEEILQTRNKCIYGVKYWVSTSYGVITLLVDENGLPIKCQTVK